MTKDERKTWAAQQYKEGAKVRDICLALNITTPTFYRWCRMDIEPRKEALWNNTGEVDQRKSIGIKAAWERRFNDTERAIREKVTKSKCLSLLEIISRLNLSLGIDNMGHFLAHETRDGKLYLTDGEFKALSKEPVQTLKALAVRINSTFREEA